jgi:hypothetical protein
VLNDLMKAFFWTPHQQMFVLLIPLAAISLGRWLLLAQPPWPVIALLGLGLGLASLIYGNAIIAAGVLALILLAPRLARRRPGAGAGRRVRDRAPDLGLGLPPDQRHLPQQ